MKHLNGYYMDGSRLALFAAFPEHQDVVLQPR